MKTHGYCTLKANPQFKIRYNAEVPPLDTIFKIISIKENDFTIQSIADTSFVSIIDVGDIDKSFYCDEINETFLVPPGMDTYATYEYNKSEIHKKETQLEFAIIPGFGCDIDKIQQYSKKYKPLIILSSLQKGVLDQSILLTA